MPADDSSDHSGPAQTEGHLYWVDWLRFLAALLVVIDHTRMVNWQPWRDPYGGPHPVAMGTFLSFTQLGHQAVVLFFVLSGLLVGGKTLARVRHGTFDAAAYAADRVSRVYVPLVPALLLNAAIVRGYDLPFHPLDFLGCLAGLQGVITVRPTLNLPLWTLAYEIWFYVLAGGAGMLCARGMATGKRLAAGVGVVLALAVLCVQLDVAFLVCWLVGAGGFALRDRIKRGRAPLAIAGALVAAVGVYVYQTDILILPTPLDVYAIWLPTVNKAEIITAMGCVLFVACVVQMRPRSRGAVWLEASGTRLAAFSYTLYLTHFPVLYLLAGTSERMPSVVDGPSMGRALAWMAVVMLVAAAMYAMFEARTLAVRRWLRARFDQPRQRPNHVPQPNTPSGASVPARTRASI